MRNFKQANVEATQTVDIVVREGQIEPYYYDTPYYLEPSKRAQKSYALLRETLRQTKKVAVGNVVLRTKQSSSSANPCRRDAAVDYAALCA